MSGIGKSIETVADEWLPETEGKGEGEIIA